MSIDIETIAVGITALLPIYGSLAYLVILSTTNKNNIETMQEDIEDLRLYQKSCKYCAKGVEAN